MRSDEIISALIGLVGACGNNPKTENTDTVVVRALAFSGCYDDGVPQKVVSEIRSEKNKVAPNCAVCQTPCGNTSDYDMSRIYNAREEIRDLKLRILDVLQELAECVLNDDSFLDETVGIIYKALAYVSFDIGEKDLTAVLEEAAEINEYVRGKNDDKKNN